MKKPLQKKMSELLVHLRRTDQRAAVITHALTVKHLRNINRVAVERGLTPFRRGLGKLRQGRRRRKLAPGHAIGAVIHDDGGELLASRRRVQKLSEADVKRVA